MSRPPLRLTCRRATLQLLIAGFLTAVVFAAGAQDVAIKGAQVVLEPRSIPVESVTIENRRKSPLVAWEIGLFEPNAHAHRLTVTSDFTRQTLHAGFTSGPITPNERRTIEIPLYDDRSLGSPAIRLAVFADGYIEGVAEAVERWQKQRQERADDAAYWIRALGSMPVVSEEAARQHLATRTAERTAEAPGDPSGIRGRLSRILQQPVQPPGWLFAVLEPMRADAQRQYATLTARTAAPALEASAPLVVSSQRSVMIEHVAVVTNLREVPIEAVGVEVLEPGTDRARSGITSDYCPSDRVTSSPTGTGPIAPGASREFRLSIRPRDGSTLPSVRISVVLFDDLQFEGSVAQRDMLLRSRERQADDLAFATVVRSEAAAKPAGEVMAFLVAKRAERLKQLEAQRVSLNVRLLDDLIEQAKASPEGLLSNVALLAEHERQQQRLLRHLKR